ncbi:MAG: prepilin-type N-terminal cleavage/methylation domain-containing protein [Clostridia bacterium]|nr:prepilin-type N-terminal cleavage/methylation domain-containing protein [Clostridia bacterium]
MVSNTNGFTLIEIITVLAIIGIALACFSPGLMHLYEQWQLDTFVDNFIMDIRFSRQLAISKGYRHLVELNLEGKYYYLRGDYVTQPSLKKVELPVCIQTITTTFKKNPSGYITIIFNENGAPGGGGTIEFSTKNDKKATITVLPVTGRVQKK